MNELKNGINAKEHINKRPRKATMKQEEHGAKSRNKRGTRYVTRGEKEKERTEVRPRIRQVEEK